MRQVTETMWPPAVSTAAICQCCSMQFSRYALQKYIYSNILRHRLLSSAYNARDKTVPYGGTGNIEIFKGGDGHGAIGKVNKLPYYS